MGRASICWPSGLILGCYERHCHGQTDTPAPGSGGIGRFLLGPPALTRHADMLLLSCLRSPRTCCAPGWRLLPLVVHRGGVGLLY